MTTKQSNNIENKQDKLEESYEEYTQREIEHIDKYKLLTGDSMSDEDIYEIIMRHNYDDSLIREEISEFKKLLKFKGEDYGWTKIEKGKSKIINLI